MVVTAPERRVVAHAEGFSIMKACRAGSFLLCLVLALPALAAQPIGRVVAIQGEAVATGADGAVRKLKLKSSIFQNDTIATREGAKLQILLNDETILAQGEQSEMVLDEYAYDPAAAKKGGFGLGLMSGLFRVITGKIADKNPDRFRVKTRKAVIGIRGCELGFELFAEREEIYVFRVPAGRKVFVEKLGEENARFLRALDIAAGGVAISVQPGVGLKRRPAGPDDQSDIIERSTPVPGAKDEGLSEKSDDAPVREAGGGAGTDGRESVLGKVDDESSRAVQDDPGRLDLPEPDDGDVVHRVTSARPTSGPNLQGPTTPPPPPGPGPGPPGGPGPGGPPPPPPGGPAASASGQDWVWGIWDQDPVLIDVTGMQLLAGELTALVAGAIQYSLSGNGSSGALITHSGTRKLVTGPCALQVEVGPANTSWAGQFNLSNTGGYSLVFDAAGTIQGAGVLTGNRTAYSMQVDGVAFDSGSVSSERIEGFLCGPGSGGGPITGAVGDYEFVHGAAARVDGAFGSDLN